MAILTTCHLCSKSYLGVQSGCDCFIEKMKELMSLKIEAGEYYTTRDGLKALVYAVYDNEVHGVIFQSHPNSRVLATWTITGSGWRVGQNGNDLVSKWREPAKFDLMTKWNKCDCGFLYPETVFEEDLINVRGKLTFEEIL